MVSFVTSNDEFPPTEVVMVIFDGLPTGILEDEVLMLVTEALSNALRHSRGTEVAVVVDADASWVRLLVEDNGIGFDPAASAGGMGLANLAARAKRLGGDAEVKSEIGKGTIVEVRLPLS